MKPRYQLSREKARRNQMPGAKEERILPAGAQGRRRRRRRRARSGAPRPAAAGFKCPAGRPAPVPRPQAWSPRPLAPDRPRGQVQGQPAACPPRVCHRRGLPCVAWRWGPAGPGATGAASASRSPLTPRNRKPDPTLLRSTWRSICRRCSSGAFLSREVVARTQAGS